MIQLSSEQIQVDTETPDVEICVQNSTMIVSACTAMYYNWTSVDMPNCWENYFRSGAPGSSTKCYYFGVADKFRMATGLEYDSRDALRRIDFYWHIDNKSNVTYASISVPAITVQLYHPKFTTWRPETIGTTLVAVIPKIKLCFSCVASVTLTKLKLACRHV